MQVDDKRQELEKLYASWQDIRKDFAVPTLGSEANAEEIYRRDLINIAENIDIAVPLEYLSHRKLVGPLIALVKNLVAKLGSPFVKVILHRQRVINQHVLSLASQIADIDARLRKLEEGRPKH
jgi:hypothetical protein